MRVMNEQLTISQEDHARVSRQYKRNLEVLNAELHELRATVSRQSAQLATQARQLEDLGHVNEALAREKKRLYEEVLAKSHGAHSANTSPTAGDQCRYSASDGVPIATPAEQQTIRRALKKLEAENSRLDAANVELRTETKRLHQQIVGLRQNSNAQQVAKMEKEIQRSREALDEGSKKLTDLEGELLRTKGILKERDTRIQHMKDEYNKLFAALQKLKQTSPSRPVHSAGSSSLLRRMRSTASTSSLASAADPASSGAGESDQANENPYLLEHYRAKIEQLEKQIERLQTQFRKIIASEYRHKQKNKLLRSERMQLVDSCDRLRGELERAVMTTAKAMSQNTSLAAKQQQQQQQHPPSLASQDDHDGVGDANGDDSAVRESISDLVRLRQRNQYLEERFRALDPPATTSPAPQRRGSEAANNRDADIASPPTTTEATPQHSAKEVSATARALQELQHSARQNRPQSAGASTQAARRSSSSLRVGASPLAVQPRSLL
ncbi:hypothetical protein PINS_up007444 [Pythium insidiosum]|nr:hypothetical protein PINS_up007444 [Pythium insidiosum]